MLAVRWNDLMGLYREPSLMPAEAEIPAVAPVRIAK
jgi:hypothetical protein